MNGKNVGMHDHTQTEQIHAVVVTSFSAATAAMTRRGDKQVDTKCCRLLLPTTDKQQGHLSRQQIYYMHPHI